QLSLSPIAACFRVGLVLYPDVPRFCAPASVLPAPFRHGIMILQFYSPSPRCSLASGPHFQTTSPCSSTSRNVSRFYPDITVLPLDATFHLRSGLALRSDMPRIGPHSAQY